LKSFYDVVKRDKAYPCGKLLTAPDNKDSDMALTILAEQQDGLLTLTFNRPEKRNALNTETYLALTDALRQAARDGFQTDCAEDFHRRAFDERNQKPEPKRQPSGKQLRQLLHESTS
jgi:hypothetical protein